MRKWEELGSRVQFCTTCADISVVVSRCLCSRCWRLLVNSRTVLHVTVAKWGYNIKYIGLKGLYLRVFLFVFFWLDYNCILVCPCRRCKFTFLSGIECKYVFHFPRLMALKSILPIATIIHGKLFKKSICLYSACIVFWMS